MDLLAAQRITEDQFLDQILYITQSIGSSETIHITESDQNEITEFEEDDDPTTDGPAKGTCISCLTKMCDIILLPCFHIVVCSQCWNENKTKHEKDCDVRYKSNKRKLAIEKKKVPCPACNSAVTEAKVFEMASVQF